MNLVEAVITGTAFAVLFVYHWHLAWQVRHAPLETAIGITNRLRTEWVETILQGGKDLLAVQTMRNWVMAASFLASTAILISLGVLNAVFSSKGFQAIIHAVNMVGSRDEAVLMIKLIILLIDFFFAFFNFTLAIRYYSHASFMINVPCEVDGDLACRQTARVVNLGALHYTLGMRGFYLAVPFTLWLFGPLWLLLGVVLVTVALYKIDRTA